MTRRHDVAGEAVRWAWSTVGRWGAIGPHSRTGRRFGAFGEGSIICFPPNTIFNERYIHIGEGTMIGPNATLPPRTRRHHVRLALHGGHTLAHGARLVRRAAAAADLLPAAVECRAAHCRSAGLHAGLVTAWW